MNKIALAAALVASIVAAAPASAALVVSPATIGQRVVVQNTGEVVARFEAQDAGYSDDLFLVGRDGVIFNNKTAKVGDTLSLGSFTAGTELVFRVHVTNTGNDFYTGSASRNADGMAHAAANTDGDRTFVGFEDLASNVSDKDYNDLTFSFTNTAAAPGAVPEPATWGTLLLGLGMVGAGLRARRRATVTCACPVGVK